MDIKRLAAAQAHARNRQQQDLLQDAYRQMAFQNNRNFEQYRRDRRRNQIMGAVQLGLGAAAGVGAAFTGGMTAPAAGAFLGQGLGSLTGTPELGMAGALAGQGVGGYMQQQAMQNQMGNMAAQMGQLPQGDPRSAAYGLNREQMQMYSRLGIDPSTGMPYG